MKLRVILKMTIGTAILSALVAVLVSSLFVNSGGATIVISNNLPNAPSEMYVLKSVTQSVTAEKARDIASEVFDVWGEPQVAEGGWRVTQASQEVLIYNSGTIKYFNNHEMLNDGYVKDEFPSIADCRSVAEEFLKNLKIRGLMSTNLQVAFTDVASDTTEYVSADGAKKTAVNNIHANFALSYAGTPLWGPGAKVRVYLGKNGSVIGFIGSSWEVEIDEKVQVLAPVLAVGKLREIGYGMSMSKDMVSRATVNSVELVYLSPSPESEAARLVPVYVITGKLLGKNGSSGDLLQVVPAMP